MSGGLLRVKNNSPRALQDARADNAGQRVIEVDLRERTKNFALGGVRMFAKLPKTTEAQVLGRQLLRSGTSVGANYREAYRGRSKAERSDWGERHRRYSR